MNYSLPSNYTLPPVETFTNANGRTVEKTEFESLSEAIAVAADQSIGRCEGGKRRASKYKSKALDVLARMHTPPTQLIDKIDALKHKLEDKVELPQKTIRRRTFGHAAGCRINGLALRRRERHVWYRYDKQAEPKQIVRIAVNPSCPWNAPDSVVEYRGAAALALADLLTQQGYAVELVIADTADDDGIFVNTIIVKRSDMPLDMSDAVTALADMNFYRSVIFSIHARCLTRTPNEGLGTPIRLEASEASGFDVVLDAHVYDEASALRCVLDTMDNY